MAMSLLAQLAGKPKGTLPSPGSADPELAGARKEQVERFERDISRRIQGLPADSRGAPGPVDATAASCSTEERTSSCSVSSQPRSLDSERLGAAPRAGAGLALGVAPSTSLQVRQALSALSHFIHGDDQDEPSRTRIRTSSTGTTRTRTATDASRQRSTSLDTFGSDADDGPEELGLRRSGSSDSDADVQPQAHSEPEPGRRAVRQEWQKKQKRAHRRSNSLDLVAERGEAEVLRKLRLRAQEVGACNKTKWRRRVMWNQCFYLSIAHAYMGTAGSDRRTRRLARRLRYAIEAAVLERHPSWSQGLRDSAAGIGPPMVFADFLQIAMQVASVSREGNFLSRLAVCVLDAENGHAEAYLGPDHGSLASREEQEANFVLLLHLPGHYCCLVRDDDGGSRLNVTYNEFKERLVEQDVFLVETVA